MNDIINCAQGESGADMHQFVVYVADIIRRKNLNLFLGNDVAGVNFMFEEKSGDAGLSVAINNCPVDRGCSSVTRE